MVVVLPAPQPGGDGGDQAARGGEVERVVDSGRERVRDQTGEELVAGQVSDGVVRQMRASQESEIWINGGFFIFRKEIFDYISEGDELVHQPFSRLIERGDLLAYRYEGFWRAMDTLRDRQVLEEMIERGETPWQLSGRAAVVKP